MDKSSTQKPTRPKPYPYFQRSQFLALLYSKVHPPFLKEKPPLELSKKWPQAQNPPILFPCQITTHCTHPTTNHPTTTQWHKNSPSTKPENHSSTDKTKPQARNVKLWEAIEFYKWSTGGEDLWKSVDELPLMFPVEEGTGRDKMRRNAFVIRLLNVGVGVGVFCLQLATTHSTLSLTMNEWYDMVCKILHDLSKRAQQRNNP